MNHAVFKVSLFMAAGIIDHEAGTRDMRRPVELLVLICLLVGIFPGVTLGPTLNDALRAMLAGPEGPPLIHSLCAIRVFEGLMLLLTRRVPERAVALFGTDR